MPNSLMRAEPPFPAPGPAPDGVRLRQLERTDLATVGAGYWRTYLGTDAEMARAEAESDVLAAWDGDYGRWRAASSLGAWTREGLVGAVLVVDDAPWPDVPAGPFVIDLFVVPEARGAGIGRALVRAALATCDAPVGLRVDDTAVAAAALYSGLGFAVV